MGEKFDECVVYVYDANGALATESIVLSHNVEDDTIIVSPTAGLIDNAQYNLMILTPDAPYSFIGIVGLRNDQLIIKLFNGEKAEKRGDKRHNITGEAEVTAYLWGGNVFKLHSALKAKLVNISKNGIRISMGYNSMSVGDVIHIRMLIQNKPQILTALVVNEVDHDRERSDYGCKLVEKGISG